MLRLIKAGHARALRTCARLDLPRLATLLVLPALRTLKHAEKGARSRTVVILPKAGFTEDVMEALRSARNVRVLVLPRILIHRIAGEFLPYFVDDNNYASCGTQYDDNKSRYRRFLQRMIAFLTRFVPIDACVTGNFSYAPDRELASAMTALRIPFIALHKENLKTPGRFSFFEKVYAERRGPFTGSLVLVYNEIERDLQLKSGVAERVVVCGMPRLDRVHAWRKGNVGKTVSGRILFFAFSPSTGMPRIARKTATPGIVQFEEKDADAAAPAISLSSLCASVYSVMRVVAETQPEIVVTIKTKGRHRDFEEVLGLLGFEAESALPRNLRIVHGGDALPAIAEASVICGFNSTALCEALAAGKPVVLPWFAEALMPEVAPFVIDLRSVCAVAASEKAIHDQLLRLAREPASTPDELSPEVSRVLDYWTGNSRGDASKRACEAICRELAIS
jgi:hypothetical protein